ncbi:hypothetical protein HYC85_030974 [Camellia sinensis]|uniref:NusB/RsmB/TIM44 domain-containing protein n=1 Tax=Camellia sinensis TaxID=4442 RepID=A0A7J7FQC1_CAMSI|nr:hypothetical protein HYC85_030974 [Camellia sinensis]
MCPDRSKNHQKREPPQTWPERDLSHGTLTSILQIEIQKNQPAGRILELCILHLAMSEITVLGTRHQIVINEAVDIAKRFCDGAAPRIINGCLSTFVKNLEENGIAQGLGSKQTLFN